MPSGRHGIVTRVTHGGVQTTAAQVHLVLIRQANTGGSGVIPVLLPVTVVIKNPGRDKGFASQPEPDGRDQVAFTSAVATTPRSTAPVPTS